ncbi:MAG: sodium:proton antiporter [Cyanobacteriota bacterium]
MRLFDIVSIILFICAIFSFINFKYLKLPNTIGIMLITIISSLFLLFLKLFGLNLYDHILVFTQSISFDKALLEWMLCFLLFSGSISVNIEDLKEYKWSILVFSTISLIISVFLISTSLYYLLISFNINLSYIYCLLFGALISPTDPIAVLGILRKAKTPREIEINIVGESLFNDGFGVVIFVVLMNILLAKEAFSISSVFLLFLRESVGGIVLGIISGLIAYKMIKQIDNYLIEILITLSLVTSLYSIASILHVSGLLGVIVAGILIGNKARNSVMSDKTKIHLDIFWEIIDELLNFMLFALIGLQLLNINFSLEYIIISLCVIPIALISRFISIFIPVSILKLIQNIIPNTSKIMTWGGLRGGLSIALALSLPNGDEKNLILVMTYSIVIFAIIVQGLTIKYLVKSND